MTESATAMDRIASLSRLIPSLPAIMRKGGWTRAATLMQKWLDNPINNDPWRGVPDIDTVRMSWILAFPRAARAYDEMVRNRIWMNEAGRGAIAKRLRGDGLLPGVRNGTCKFGPLPGGPASSAFDMTVLHDRFHIQTRRVQQSGLGAPMDELTAALANFAFHVIVAGDVRLIERGRAESRYQVSIRHVGIYARDTYDFNGHGGLPHPRGFWGCGLGQGETRPAQGWPLNNEAFRLWRTGHGGGRGGDYLVYSDIQWLERDDTFEMRLD